MAGPYPSSDYQATVAPGEFPGGTAPPNRFREWFSWAAVSALASASGLVCQTLEIDANKVDVLLNTWSDWEGRVRYVGLQLKSTSSPNFVGPPGEQRLAFELSGTDYNELLKPCTFNRYLVVVALAPLDENWVLLGSSNLNLSAAAWWMKIEGEETDQTTITVHLPVDQRFDVQALREMLEAA